MKAEKKARYPLAIDESVKVLAEGEAKQNRRSLNAELGLLIEEGLRWRQAQKASQAAA